jgi:hypothetical protein
VVFKRKVKFEDFVEFALGVVEVFTQQRWVEMLSTSEEVSPTLFHEFYTNMHDFQEHTFQSMIQGKPILVSPALICEFISTPLVDDSPYLCTPE